MKSEQATWKCVYCTKEFKYESEKRRHEQSHDPQFQCKACSKKFSFLSALRRHEKQHARSGRVQCKKCGGNFRDESLLKRHMQYAHKGTVSCPQCSIMCNSDLALRAHLKTHQSESERKHHCSFEGCNKTFNFLHHLKHHELTHTNTKQYFCQECGKGFIQSHHLKSHLKKHDPKTWIKCTETNCNKKFISEYARKRHLSTHKTRNVSDSSDSCLSPESKKHMKVIVWCPACSEMITQPNYEDHVRDCILRKETPDCSIMIKAEPSPISVRSLELSINEISDTIDKVESVNIKDVLIDKENLEEHSISDCKSVIGSCLSNENCLCAEINKENQIDKFGESISSSDRNINTDAVSNRDNVIKFSTDLKSLVSVKDAIIETKECVGCDCDNWCSNENNTGNISLLRDESPIIEYMLDGTVKIKETCDLNIQMDNSSQHNKVDSMDITNDLPFKEYRRETKAVSELKMIPFNSCRDVLGNCIVSGNGTIGEGCLCARMVADDRPMIAQEIEEITPCPKSSSLSENL